MVSLLNSYQSIQRINVAQRTRLGPPCSSSVFPRLFVVTCCSQILPNASWFSNLGYAPPALALRYAPKQAHLPPHPVANTLFSLWAFSLQSCQPNHTWERLSSYLHLKLQTFKIQLWGFMALKIKTVETVKAKLWFLLSYVQTKGELAFVHICVLILWLHLNLSQCVMGTSSAHGELGDLTTARRAPVLAKQQERK